MPIKCCITSCGARQGKAKVSFHRFPSIQTARDAIRRELWIKAAGMCGKNVTKQYICGHHFETDKPAACNDTSAENWIPTLRLGISSHTHDESCDGTGSPMETKFGFNATESNNDTSTGDARAYLLMDLKLENVDVQDILDEERNFSTMVISVVVTGRLTVAEASSRYGIPYVTLYNSVLGHQNRMGVLQKITLGREEEDQIMKYCVKSLPGRKAKKVITQPLEKIWEFLNCLESFHEKADEFRFGEVSFYRWWWAFCRHHNINAHPSKHVTRDNSESPSVDVATTLDDSETPIVDDATNRDNEDVSTIPSWTRMAELKEAIFDIVTGQLSFPEASSQYNLSEHTLYSRILGQTDRMAVLQEVSLSIEEEDKILRLCTTIPPECTAKRTVTQPLETIWDFMHHLGDFREKADQFRFGGIAFYRWFWAFCQKHNVDERLPKQETN